MKAIPAIAALLLALNLNTFATGEHLDTSGLPAKTLTVPAQELKEPGSLATHVALKKEDLDVLAKTWKVKLVTCAYGFYVAEGQETNTAFWVIPAPGIMHEQGGTNWNLFLVSFEPQSPKKAAQVREALGLPAKN